jgi:hypothetical protein
MDSITGTPKLTQEEMDAEKRANALRFIEAINWSDLTTRTLVEVTRTVTFHKQLETPEADTSLARSLCL